MAQKQNPGKGTKMHPDPRNQRGSLHPSLHSTLVCGTLDSGRSGNRSIGAVPLQAIICQRRYVAYQKIY